MNKPKGVLSVGCLPIVPNLPFDERFRLHQHLHRHLSIYRLLACCIPSIGNATTWLYFRQTSQRRSPCAHHIIPR